MLRNPRLIFGAQLFIFWLSGLSLLAGTQGKSNNDSLQPGESDQPYHVIELEMSTAHYKKVQSAQGQKLYLENTTLKFNGKPVSLKEIHLHGKSTLYYERKSFSVDASEKIKICKEGCKPMDAFYLVSLSMDRNYFHNRLCFDLLKELNLFHLQYKYAEVKINGNSQGIYLLLQRPQDWSIKTVESPSIIRRGLNHVIDKQRFEKGIDKNTAKVYRHQFNSIYKLIDQYSGEDLYARLNEILHVEDYLRWLAFNYIVRDGDYSDELYFYIDPKTKRFRIIPWDYDDIFKAGPHEGIEVWKSKMDPSSLIFSAEDELDVKIAHDPYLYDQYLRCLSSVMEELKEEKVESVVNKIYEDLSPLFKSDEIIQAASKDGYKTSLENLRVDIVSVNQYFNNMRATLIKKNVIK